MATAAAFPETECVGITIDGMFPLLRWLGGTAHSSVFLTELPGTPPQKAAIKFTHADAVDAGSRLVEPPGTLSHPHLLRVFHTGRWKAERADLLYVVTEYADEVLSDILRDRSLTPDEAREMLSPLMDALGWLHSRNLVHGHLKPSNILVAGEQLKLSSDRLHVPGQPGWASSSSGKYDAPEATTLTMSPAADLWSLGMVLVEALTQWPPRWDGRDDPIVPPFLPAPLARVARECLRVDPARRVTLSGIRDILDPPPPAAAAGKTSAARPSRTWALIAVATLAVGGIATALFFGLHHHASSTAVVPAPASQAPAPTPAPASQAPASAPTSPTQVPPPASASAAPATPAPAHASPQPVPAAAPPFAPDTPPPPEVLPGVLKGAVAQQLIPDVPQHIRDTIQGHIRVEISVEVDADGKVAAATADAPGPSRYFANQALEAARDWTFTPPQQNGRPVPSRWTLLFRFGQTETTATATETAPRP